MTLFAAGALPAPAVAVVQLITASQRPLIVFHEHPDGDALGSSLALLLALRKLGKEPLAACVDPPPQYYRFLPGSEDVAVAPREGDHDLAILVDCADLQRAGALVQLATACPRLVNIDHHPTNNGYGDAAWVEPVAAASAELVVPIITALGVAVDPDIATCIYTAVLTDTGSFHYSNTTPACLRLAGEMVAQGARPDLISEAVYEQRPRADIELIAAGLQTLRLTDDGKVAWLSLDRAVMDATRGDSEGIVNYGRMIAGVEVAILFREQAPGDIKVSFRSRNVDVATLASEFGGGGHPRAAGCTFHGSLADAEATIVRRTAECVSG
ncbi:MAG: DHH family phosphoesterase [Chloroflexota bacterium]